MAKVSNKTLGKRRRGALYVVLILLVCIISLVVQCSKTSPETEQTDVRIEVSSDTTTATQATMQSTYQAENQLKTPEPEDSRAEQMGELPEATLIDGIDPILQTPELPTGCEITSLTMVLNFLGFDVDKCTMADNYLVRADPYTATFGEAFVGSPYDPTAWGCYAPVIVETAENFLADMGSDLQVYNLTGSEVETLFWEVSQGNPVIVWASIDMTDNIEERYYWTTEEGKDAVFLINEHCLVLCGYDYASRTVTMCDPMVGLVEYDMDIFADRYERLYRQAVLLVE